MDRPPAALTTRRSDVELAAATASASYTILVAGVLALMLGLLLVAGWRAGTLGRLRALLVERVAAIGDVSPEEATERAG